MSIGTTSLSLTSSKSIPSPSSQALEFILRWLRISSQWSRYLNSLPASVERVKAIDMGFELVQNFEEESLALFYHKSFESAEIGDEGYVDKDIEQSLDNVFLRMDDIRQHVNVMTITFSAILEGVFREDGFPEDEGQLPEEYEEALVSIVERIMGLARDGEWDFSLPKGYVEGHPDGDMKDFFQEKMDDWEEYVRQKESGEDDEGEGEDDDEDEKYGEGSEQGSLAEEQWEEEAESDNIVQRKSVKVVAEDKRA